MRPFKDWQLPIVELFRSGKYDETNPLRARDAWLYTVGEGSDIGRASVVVFLQTLTARGLLKRRKQAARGGYHGVYWMTPELEETYQSLKGSTKNEK